MAVAEANSTLSYAANPLDPEYVKLDGRTDTERLAFAAAYGNLINFYDKNNKKSGNWNPFFMKDPIVLTASMAHTNYKPVYTVYKKAIEELGYVMYSGEDYRMNLKDRTVFQFNVLFEVYELLFQRINYWLEFMITDNKTYALKSFLIKQVEDTFGALLWATVQLQSGLSTETEYEGLKKPNPLDYENFPIQWRQNNVSYFSVLGLQSPLSSNTSAGIFEALKEVGSQLFPFFIKLVKHAKAAYEELLTKDDIYPDTTLLIAFSQLMNVHQEQLNGVTQRHLNFYYNDILKQSEALATPDQAYLCLTLNPNTTSYILPQGTKFNGGLNANKETIVFTSNTETILNEIIAKATYTLTEVASENDKKFKELFQYIDTKPSKLLKQTNGAVANRPFFDATKGKNTKVELGFAVASPMLYLQQGTRIVDIILEFVHTPCHGLLADAEFYLSTAKKWEQIDDVSVSSPTGETREIELSFTLDVTVPAIEAFPKNPDGYVSDWPILKVILPDFCGTKPPKLEAVQISTEVTGMKDFTLFNDDGALTAKHPFLPFGPIPHQHSNFYIGSAEIFSKPIESMDLTITWNNLPNDNFRDYYEPYNNYLRDKLCPNQISHITDPEAPDHGGDGAINTAMAGAAGSTDVVRETWLTKLTNWITGKKSSTETRAALVDELEDDNFLIDNSDTGYEEDEFTNSAFAVTFGALTDSNWVDLKFNATDWSPWLLHDELLLFNEETDGGLSKTSYFSYKEPKLKQSQKLAADPELQLQPLTFTQESTGGFLKMDLTEPYHGFGFDLYGEVVSAVALCNAVSITEIIKPSAHPPTSQVIPTPKQPFAPKATEIEIKYTAEQWYHFDDISSTAPFEFYYYGAFENYQVLPVVDSTTADTKSVDPANETGADGAISLFEAPLGAATYYIQLEKVDAPAPLSMFFEVATEMEIEQPAPLPVLSYYYMSSTGWKSMDVLSDSTKGFVCSGILSVNLPDDASDSYKSMPDNFYWIAVATDKAPDFYPELVYMNTQAVAVTRSGTNYLEDTTPPTLAADKITGPLTKIPEISAVVQPFASFGGRRAEDNMMYYTRVSERIKNKKRLTIQNDYRQYILRSYPSIFDVKTIVGGLQTGSVELGLVNNVSNWTNANAFRPFVTECVVETVQGAVTKVASPFARLEVFSMKFAVLFIKVDITVDSPASSLRIQEDVNHALMLYLSPWIAGDQPKIEFDQGVSKAGVIDLLSQNPKVLEANNVEWSIGSLVNGVMEPTTWSNEDVFDDIDPNEIIVTAYQHVITAKGS